MLQGIVDLVFPMVCVSCGRPGTSICAHHINDLVWNYSLNSEWVFSAVEYRDAAQQIVRTVKYDFAYRYIELMAQLIHLRFPDFVQKNNIDCLVPVPLHPKRQRWRGFNQAQILAKLLGKRWSVTVESSSLVRHRYSDAQAGKNLDQREGITHSFQLARPLGGTRICLIDDVVTTGSTLSACREVLTSKRVFALTFASER